MDKEYLAGALGVLDPVLKRLAQQLAERLPRGTVIESQIFEAAVGVVKNFIEAYAERFGTIPSVLVERTTDFFDMLLGAMPQGAAAPFLDEWMSAFLREAEERLGKSSDPGVEFEKLSQELEVRHEFLKNFEERMAHKPGGRAALTSKEKFERAWAGIAKTLQGADRGLSPMADRIRKFKERMEKKGGFRK